MTTQPLIHEGPTDTMDATPIMQRLRAQTRAAHDTVEGIAYSESILDGSVTRARYAAQLHAWAAFYEALEQALSDSDHPTIAAVWSEERCKTPWLRGDLAALDPHAEHVLPAAQQLAGEWADTIRALAADDPVGLLGILYVLEGSTLGGTVLYKKLSEALDLTPTTGLRFHAGYGQETAARWRAFCAAMNDAVIDPGEQERVLEHARRAFRHIARMLTALS